MNYLSDDKNNQSDPVQSGDDLVTRTLSSLSRRVDRRRSFIWSLVFLCVIFSLCVAVGCLLYVYMCANGGAWHFDTYVGKAFTDWIRIALKRYLYASLPAAFVFIMGFTRIASLCNGLICAFLGVWCGYTAVDMYLRVVSIADCAHVLAVMLCVGAYCFTVVYFSAVCVSFSHSVKNMPQFIDKMFVEDLRCYLKYFMTCVSWILLICIACCLI